MSLAEAREKAFELRRIARNGGNPKVRTREDEGKTTTFKELACLVHERKFKDNKNNGKHIAQWIRTLETYAFPTLANLTVSEIHQDDIEAVLDPIWTAKPETARRVLQRISTVFDFACGRGYRTTGNPATEMLSSMRPQRQKAEHFKALDYHDLPELTAKLLSQNAVGALALRLTILTAERSASVRFAQWDHFDDALTEWTIPAELIKTRNEFVVPISTHARKVLLAQDAISVFGGVVDHHCVFHAQASEIASLRRVRRDGCGDCRFAQSGRARNHRHFTGLEQVFYDKWSVDTWPKLTGFAHSRRRIRLVVGGRGFHGQSFVSG